MRSSCFAEIGKKASASPKRQSPHVIIYSKGKDKKKSFKNGVLKKAGKGPTEKRAGRMALCG